MRWLFCVLGLVALFGCAHKKPKLDPGVSDSGFWKEQKVRRTQVNHLSAKVNLTLRGTKRSVSGRGGIIVQFPKQVRLELRDPFGRLHYVVGVDGKKFVAYYPRRRLAFYDKHSGNDYLKTILGVDLDFLSLQSFLLGELPKEVTRFSSWEWDEILGWYQGKAKYRDYEMVVYVDPDKFTIRRIQLSGDRGDIRGDYSLFERCCQGGRTKLWFANVVELKFSKTAMDLEWVKTQVTKKRWPKSAFQIRVDGKAKKINLPR